jgi:hypothetical protein
MEREQQNKQKWWMPIIIAVSPIIVFVGTITYIDSEFVSEEEMKSLKAEELDSIEGRQRRYINRFNEFKDSVTEELHRQELVDKDHEKEMMRVEKDAKIERLELELRLRK